MKRAKDVVKERPSMSICRRPYRRPGRFTVGIATAVTGGFLGARMQLDPD